MCRFTVRQGGQALQPAAAETKPLDAPIDLGALFANDDGELGPDDLALLALFTGTSGPPAPEQPAAPQQQPTSAGSSAGSPMEPSAATTVVMGQALTAPAPQQPAAVPVPAPVAVPAVPANPVQQLQFQAAFQHQAAMLQNPAPFPATVYQQALLQQQQLALAQQQAAAAAALPLPVAPPSAPVLVGKRGKTQEEVEEQTERIKKRRRESAQRSRQRKNAYMKSLEMENRALKLECERLRAELQKSSGGALAPETAAAVSAPKASSGSVSRQPSTHAPADSLADGSTHSDSMGEEEDEAPLCGALLGGLPNATSAALPDPLALMPTADLLHFAF